MVTKADFVKLGQDMKLLDFGGAMGDKRKPQSPRKSRGREEERKEKVGREKILLFIFVSKASRKSTIGLLLPNRK